MLGGDPNLPNGGILARFPGFYIPILDLSFDGPEPTDTQFDTAVVTRQYDGVADFPLYPLNVVSHLNAVPGVFYVHAYAFGDSLTHDPSTSRLPESNTVTPTTTSSKPRTCRCSLRCASWGCPSR